MVQEICLQVVSYMLSQGSSLQYCGEFANYGAAKLVEKFGPRLDKDGYTQVLKNLKKLD